MKIRRQFVSNSSSTSFCVVGVEVYKGSALLEEMGIDLCDDYEGYGYYESPDEELEVFGDGYNEGVVGFDAEKVLQYKTLPEAILTFIQYIAGEYGVLIRTDRVHLLHGEMGNG